MHAQHAHGTQGTCRTRRARACCATAPVRGRLHSLDSFVHGRRRCSSCLPCAALPACASWRSTSTPRPGPSRSSRQPKYSATFPLDLGGTPCCSHRECPLHAAACTPTTHTHTHTHTNTHMPKARSCTHAHKTHTHTHTHTHTCHKHCSCMHAHKLQRAKAQNSHVCRSVVGVHTAARSWHVCVGGVHAEQ